MRAAVVDDGGTNREDSDRAGLAGWASFERDVRAAFSISGRRANASSAQASRIVESGGRLFGFDSSGLLKASYSGRDPDSGTDPEAAADSDVTFGFEVVGSPVEFALTGELARTNASNPAPPRVVVQSPSNTVHVSAGSTTELNETGELAPGFHELSIEARATNGVPQGSSGSAQASYDIQLRFCTDVVPESGILVGTDEDEVLCGTSAPDLINAKGGNDTIFGAAESDGILGGPGDDEIFGEDGPDAQVYGGPGDDLIDAGDGDDGQGDGFESVVAGGPGDDELIGGPGDDRLVGRCLEVALGTPSPICPDDPPSAGESDDDNLSGAAGNDFLFADGGFNVIIGGPGNDRTSADGPTLFDLGGGEDKALGSAGSDELDGGAGRDDLDAEGGADCVVGGSGRDELEGREGNDKLIARDGTRDRVDGGSGPDRGRFDGADRVSAVADRELRGGC